MKRLLANEKCEASRLTILNCNQNLRYCDDGGEFYEHITKNEMLQKCLEYFHLYGNKNYSNFFFDLLDTEEIFESLYEFLLTYPTFEDLPEIISKLDEKNFKKTFEIFPKLKRVVFVNNEYAEEIQAQKAHFLDKNEPIFSNKSSVAITTINGQKFIGTKIFMDKGDSVILKPDILFEFRLVGSTDEVYSICKEYTKEYLIEISLINILAVDMSIKRNDLTSQNSMSKLTQLLAEKNPNAKCRLQVIGRNTEDCEDQFYNLHHLVLKE
mmetsp:Transcript_27093/g.23950  ORF Transcript_27093/g.23950 Transcript_27093/m.23950 type:complete len:268 (+) Transcript_27093:706-1509(+)|eukprot:CAMPEP_0205800230 /NCGR_PEP_ID=MMETSP0205-20121125/1828_1 /ASSEMBLY_ACC=CAM_ASM_000278 /TAXON_ID=36767 /ORGANISM="Euplotes focardii, Strain TN1" /LENGTH=267 /DNA_ID=CAMNT_0053062989 /DNA_START=634 /DNA_END=1437 /DNA_ORIENTATION=+